MVKVTLNLWSSQIVLSLGGVFYIHLLSGDLYLCQQAAQYSYSNEVQKTVVCLLRLFFYKCVLSSIVVLHVQNALNFRQKVCALYYVNA